MILKTDNLGIPRFTKHNLMDIIYTGQLDKCHIVLCDPDDDIDRFNELMEEQGLPTLSKYVPIDVDQKTFDAACQSEWFMPDKYKNLDIMDYLLTRVMEELQCPDDVHVLDNTVEWDRVRAEMNAFNNHNMINMLRYMVYLVDFMRENKIVWGVGRGSSVASYVLYLIGIHKIDSLKYNLDWREFLR